MKKFATIYCLYHLLSLALRLEMAIEENKASFADIPVGAPKVGATFFLITANFVCVCVSNYYPLDSHSRKES